MNSPASDRKWLEQHCPQLVRDIEFWSQSGADAAHRELATQRMDAFAERVLSDIKALPPGKADSAADNRDAAAPRRFHCLRCGNSYEATAPPPPADHYPMRLCPECLDECGRDDFRFFLRIAIDASKFQYRLLQPYLATLESAVAARDKAIVAERERLSERQLAVEHWFAQAEWFRARAGALHAQRNTFAVWATLFAALYLFTLIF